MKPRSLVPICFLLAASEALGGSAKAEPPPEKNNVLVVQVRGLRNANGLLLVLVFNSARGFPDKPDKALRSQIVGLTATEQTVSFTGLEPGEYAVSFVHDENSNHKLDVNFLGIPKEGFGTSNNVRPTIGAPAYRDAKFYYAGGERVLELRPIYY